MIVALFKNTLTELAAKIEAEAASSMSNSTFSDTVGCEDFGYDGVFETFEVSKRLSE